MGKTFIKRFKINLPHYLAAVSDEFKFSTSTNSKRVHINLDEIYTQKEFPPRDCTRILECWSRDAFSQ